MDRINATLFWFDTIFSQIFNEIDIPIMVSTFTDFELYGVLWYLAIL